MKEFIELTEEFSRRIEEMENQRKKLGDFLREVSSSTNLPPDRDIFEEKIILPMENLDLANMKIAGVDGGLVKHTLHGLDIMLLRAVGVIFYYKDGKLEKVDYHPDAIPSPNPRIFFDPFTDLEFEINSNYERQLTEVKNATEVIDKFEPDILFLNGSVVPHYTERPPEHSLLFPTYKKLIEAYANLFKKCEEKKTALAGVIEDSRGTRFCEVINEKLMLKIPNELVEIKLLLNKTKDTNLLTYALKLKERSFLFRYSSSPDQHPILKEFGGKIANSIFCFYLKTAEFDRPIRVDFLAEKDFTKIANFISSILLSLSGHSSYGMPSVLIEADQRAKLSEKDLEMFYLDLINRAGNLPGLFTLRREQRPF
ncbi:MAG TPA: DNA double-strand break repair nuclease NurA [archaeon]|nr:DNA double-strand break repair nuclease NurA [archaeon]